MTTRTPTIDADILDDLTEIPASEVKRSGWRGVMTEVKIRGAVVITNHATPEAVVLPTAEYLRLRIAERRADEHAAQQLDVLRQRFDERLASLETPTAADRLRGVMDTPLQLKGRVKAGTGH